MLKKHRLLLVIFCLLSNHVLASTITLQTRAIQNSQFNQSDYRQAWTQHSSSLTSKNLSEFNNVHVAQHHTKNPVFSYLKTTFTIGEDFADNLWGFRAGMDAGLGGALYLDGQLVDIDASDLWWKHNWNNESEILKAGFIEDLSEGFHVLELFWAESCCHGSNSGQFTIDGGQSWQTLSVARLDAIAAVPLPASAWLFVTGFVSLTSLRRVRSIRLGHIGN
ncbi:MAG: CCXG family PEP-CTERM protein [Gammaproteobacteria bacterium]|nr:CCXG family PEP-CTERM protein [Gammaproteobacteria bacterium]